MKVKKDTIIRTVLLIFTTVNMFLTIAGKSIIPIGEQNLENWIAAGLEGAAAVWAWWKNNSFTKSAIEADVYMNTLKQEAALDKATPTVDEKEPEIKEEKKDE